MGAQGIFELCLRNRPAAGGVFSLEMRGPDGAVYPCKGVFREVVKPERIVYIGRCRRPNTPAVPGCLRTRS